jgi:hypothetical protein
VRAQCGCEVVHEPDVRGVVEALAFGENAGAREDLLDFLVALLGEVDLLRFLVDREVAGDDQLGAFRLGVDLHDVQTLFLRSRDGLARRHLAERLAVHAEQLDLRRFDVVVRFTRRRAVELELRDQLIDPHVQLRALLGSAGDDQRRARLVDQDRVDLVDDRVDELALDPVLGPEREVVTKIVEAELVVGAVRDVRRVRRALLLDGLVALDDADRETQEPVDRTHPIRVALREVFVHGNQVHALARERVQIHRQGCNERLALARAHLGDLALVQRDAAHQLHVERPHLERALRRFAHEGKRLRQQRVEVLVRGVALLEVLGLCAQLVVAQGFELRLQRVRGGDRAAISLEQPLIAAAEHAGHEIRNGAEHSGCPRDAD